MSKKITKSSSLQKFNIRALKPANPRNERGKRTWEHKMAKKGQVSFYRRLKGEKFGNHFHKGKNVSKNPEIIFFISGIVELNLVYLSGQKKKIIIDASKSPQQVTLYSYLFHSYQAITECFYIKYRSNIFNKKDPDTFSEKEFFEIMTKEKK